jgi:hypothetical protein
MSEAAPEHGPAPRRTAIDVRSEHRILRELPDGLLREIALLDEGTALERNHEYLDFHDPARACFRAEGGELVKPGQRVVARASVAAEAWNELVRACDRVLRRAALRRAG